MVRKFFYVIFFIYLYSIKCDEDIDLGDINLNKNDSIFDTEDSIPTYEESNRKSFDLNSSEFNSFLLEDEKEDNGKSGFNIDGIIKNIPNLEKSQNDSLPKNNIQKVTRKSSSSIIRSINDNFSNKIFENLNTTFSDTEWLRNLFNLHDWDMQNLPAENSLSQSCIDSMRLYLISLKNGSVWASEMNDASGKYSSQFFFGNDFWLGSRKFCMELRRPEFRTIIPPFKPHFYVVKFFVKLKNDYQLPMINRVMTVGLCLPEACNTNDIMSMLQKDASEKSSMQHERTVNVLRVRAVPGSYSILHDKKLHLLFVVLSAVIILAIMGTIYEVSLERRQSRLYKLKHMKYNNNDEDIKVVGYNGESPAIKNGATEKFDLNSSIPKLSAECKKNLGGNSVLSQLVLSFSALSNSRKILNCGPAPEDSLTCIHGLRFLSLSWVIMVHTYLQVFTVAENKVIRTLAERNFMFQTVSNATFSVDTFFFISGLLVTYLYFKSARKEIADINRRSNRKKDPSCIAGIAKFFKLVGYRLIRLTPAYMFVLLIAEISMRWLHSISVFEPVSQNHISCDKYWWRNILYINSLFPMKDMCMLWSWYVSNDTQFYILGIVILLLSMRYFRFAGGMLITFLITSWFTTILIAVHYDYRARIEDPFANFDELYDKPWTRLGPYLIGMVAGWYLFKIKCKLQFSKTILLIGWFLSLGTLFSLVYGLHLYPLGLIGSALYVSVGHSAWGLALAWIVIACCTGHGGFIDSFLSCQLLQPLSRLTYCAYLIHPIIMTVTNFQMGSPFHLQDALVLILYLGNITASFIASFCISVLFEAPVVRLLKIMTSSNPKNSANNQTNNL